MEVARRWSFRHKRQWTIGFLMILISGIGLVCVLLRPFTASAPPREIIGVSFHLEKTRLPDGRTGQGWSPKFTVTKTGVPTSKP